MGKLEEARKFISRLNDVQQRLESGELDLEKCHTNALGAMIDFVNKSDPKCVAATPNGFLLSILNELRDKEFLRLHGRSGSGTHKPSSLYQMGAYFGAVEFLMTETSLKLDEACNLVVKAANNGQTGEQLKNQRSNFDDKPIYRDASMARDKFKNSIRFWLSAMEPLDEVDKIKFVENVICVTSKKS